MQNKIQDGRRLRSERSKKAILEACVSLINKGVLIPTAQLVSDEAGIPIRTFFRHFPDMESLFKAMDDELRSAHLDQPCPETLQGSLRERIDALVDKNAVFFEKYKGIIESSKAQMWRYDILQGNYARWIKIMRKNKQQLIPEIKHKDSDTREIISGIASYEMWNRLRVHQKLSKKKSSALMKKMLYKQLDV